MSGPKRSPRNLRLLRGTLQPCRDASPSTPSLPPLNTAPTAPAWMGDAVAIAEFDRLATILAVNDLMTVGRIDALADYSMLSARTQALWQSGETPSAALLAIRRKLASDLNLSEMNLAAPSAKPNRFLSNALLHK
jgi:hypothetical protein